MVNDAAKRESTAFKDGPVSPQLAEAYATPAIIEFLITERSAGRKWMRRSRSVVRRSACVDLLMSEPSFGLHKPAASKITLVPQNSRVPVNPVIVEWSERKIGVVHPLLVRDASRVTAIKSTGVEV